MVVHPLVSLFLMVHILSGFSFFGVTIRGGFSVPSAFFLMANVIDGYTSFSFCISNVFFILCGFFVFGVLYVLSSQCIFILCLRKFVSTVA